jgi:hypothetical protein
LKRVLRSHTAVIVPNAVLIPLGAGFSIDIRKRTGTKWTVSLCHNLTVLVTTDVRRITRS